MHTNFGFLTILLFTFHLILCKCLVLPIFLKNTIVLDCKRSNIAHQSVFANHCKKTNYWKCKSRTKCTLYWYDFL